MGETVVVYVVTQPPLVYVMKYKIDRSKLLLALFMIVLHTTLDGLVRVTVQYKHYRCVERSYGGAGQRV